MTTQRIITPPSPIPAADRARWVAWERTLLARLETRIAHARGPRRLALDAQRARAAHNLAIYEREAERATS